MATKVKPCRIKATGTPQVGYVPKYVDEDTFQWGAGGGSDIVYATQAEYEALLPGAASDGKHYFIYSTSGGGGLPAEYQEVEYIESSGTQYIDTGFTPNGNTELEFDFMPTSTNGYQGYFGSDSNWDSTTFQCYNDRLFSYGDQIGTTGTYFTANTRYLLEFKNLTVSLDGTTMRTVNAETFTVPHSSLVCAVYRDANSGISNYGSERVYGLKLWDNGTLARDFIPCYRKADSVIGLYDLVNSQFYTNSGTGTFTKGSDV